MSSTFSENPEWSQLSLGDLRFFVRLCETLSLTESAQSCGMSLSTASRTLKRLRDLFEDPLFIRSFPDLIPTSRALALQSTAASLIAAAGQLRKPAAFDPSTLVRTFRIGVVDNAIFAVMTEVLRHFFIEAPHASLEYAQLGDDLFKRLENGELDCAVFPATRPLPKNVRELLLYPVSYALCTRRDHPLTQYWRTHGTIPDQEISRWRKVQVTNKSQNQNAVYALDEAVVRGETLQETAVTVPFFLAVPSILEVSDLTAVLPMQTAKRLEEKGYVTAMPLHPNQENRGRDQFFTRLIWHERMHDDPALQWLRGLFAAYAKPAD